MSDRDLHLTSLLLCIASNHGGTKDFFMTSWAAALVMPKALRIWLTWSSTLSNHAAGFSRCLAVCTNCLTVSLGNWFFCDFFAHEVLIICWATAADLFNWVMLFLLRIIVCVWQDVCVIVTTLVTWVWTLIYVCHQFPRRVRRAFSLDISVSFCTDNYQFLLWAQVT